ncbi:MAG: flagellar export chaperone FlgN [Clostridia bacterium]
MIELFEEVMSLYSKQIDIIDQFNAVSKEKANILKSNDISMLNSIIKLEEALLMRFSLAENKKQRALNILKNQYGIKKFTKRIMHKYLEPDQIRKAEKLTERFYSDLVEQEKLKTLNVKIVETRLEELRSALDIIEKKSERYYEPNVLLDKRV